MLRWLGLILKPPAIEIKFTLTLGHPCSRMSNILQNKRLYFIDTSYARVCHCKNIEAVKYWPILASAKPEFVNVF
jgi:hypothetical protein